MLALRLGGMKMNSKKKTCRNCRASICEDIPVKEWATDGIVCELWTDKVKNWKKDIKKE